VSYVSMDHACWVERNIEAGKKQHQTKSDWRKAKEGIGWQAAPDKLNPFQRRAFDILGIVGNGIYNAPIAWGGICWHPYFITVSWRHSLATWDFAALTRLVFLCHEARIRCGVAPKNFNHIEIHLSERTHLGSMSVRHPNLDEAVSDFRGYFPATHPINYPAHPPAERGGER